MTILILHKDPDGSISGRCDKRCYDAIYPKCTCICGGMNHAVGRDRAIDNTREHPFLLMDEDDAAHFINNPDRCELFPGEDKNIQ